MFVYLERIVNVNEVGKMKDFAYTSVEPRQPGRVASKQVGVKECAMASANESLTI